MFLDFFHSTLMVSLKFGVNPRIQPALPPEFRLVVVVVERCGECFLAHVEDQHCLKMSSMFNKI